jgi:hypothetical protein
MAKQKNQKTYPVDPIQWPYFHPVGVLAGMPVILIRFNPSSRVRYTADEIVRSISDVIPEEQTSRPRWVMMLGGDGIADNDLFVMMRARLNLLVYYETSGEAPMCDTGGSERLALYDHVCLRTAKAGPFACEFIHSVISENPRLRESFERLSVMLDRLPFNGPRFLLADAEFTPRARRLAESCAHSQWRVIPAGR